MRVIKNTTIYFGVSVIQSLMSFFLLPVFTYYLTEGQFGLASVTNSLFGILGIFYTLGFSGVIGRLYFDYNDNEEKLKRFLGTAFLFNIIWSLALSAMFFLSKDLIFPVIAQGVPVYPFALIAIAIAFFLTPFEIYQVLQLSRQKGWDFGIVQVIYLVLNNGITVVLLAVFNMKAEGIVLGTLIANVIMFIFLLTRISKEAKFVIDLDILKKSLSYAWPILFHALFTWGMASVNRLIVNNELSTVDAGIFTIGFTIGGIISMVAVALNRAFSPWFYGEMKKQKGKYPEIVSFAQFVVLIYSICAFGLSIFASEVISVLTHNQFSTSWQIVPFVAFAFVFQGIYFFFLNIFNYEKKYVKMIPLFTLVGAVVNIVLSYLLIKQFGIIGSAIATMISMLVLSLVVFIGSKKVLDIGYSIVKMYFPALVFFILSMAIYIPLDLPALSQIIVKAIFTLFVLIIVFFVYKNTFVQKILKQIIKIKNYLSDLKKNNNDIK